MPFDPSIGRATKWKKGQPSPNQGGRPKSRLLSEALRSRLGEIKSGDPVGRTYAEVVAENLIEIACSEGPGAVHAASEIADRLEGRSRQAIEFADITAELRNKSDAELQFYMDNNRDHPTRKNYQRPYQRYCDSFTRIVAGGCFASVTSQSPYGR